MDCNTKFELIVTEKEAAVIHDFYETTKNCPFPLNDHDLVEIISEIANHSNDLEDDAIQILYVNEEEL